MRKGVEREAQPTTVCWLLAVC